MDPRSWALVGGFEPAHQRPELGAHLLDLLGLLGLTPFEEGGPAGVEFLHQLAGERAVPDLGEVQDGTFTRELVEEFDAGKPNFLKRREAEQSEQIEQVGAQLRPLMSWLSDEES